MKILSCKILWYWMATNFSSRVGKVRFTFIEWFREMKLEWVIYREWPHPTMFLRNIQHFSVKSTLLQNYRNYLKVDFTEIFELDRIFWYLSTHIDTSINWFHEKTVDCGADYLNFTNKVLEIENFKKDFEHGRIRTCNLLIRSQTRYPLRHAPILAEMGNCTLYDVCC